jgi:rare lipoprotein A
MLDRYNCRIFPGQGAAPPLRTAAQAILLFSLLGGCVTPPPPVVPSPAPPELVSPPPTPVPIPVLETQTGLASYYHPSLHGLETASGIPFDNEGFMAAHPTYPMGTVVQVTNLDNGATVVEVVVTDRGPTAENVAKGVIIDLSGAVAELLDIVQDGLVQVKIEVIRWGDES